MRGEGDEDARKLTYTKTESAGGSDEAESKRKERERSLRPGRIEAQGTKLTRNQETRKGRAAEGQLEEDGAPLMRRLFNRPREWTGSRGSSKTRESQSTTRHGK